MIEEQSAEQVSDKKFYSFIPPSHTIHPQTSRYLLRVSKKKKETLRRPQLIPPGDRPRKVVRFPAFRPRSPLPPQQSGNWCSLSLRLKWRFTISLAFNKVLKLPFNVGQLWRNLLLRRRFLDERIVTGRVLELGRNIVWATQMSSQEINCPLN